MSATSAGALSPVTTTMSEVIAQKVARAVASLRWIPKSAVRFRAVVGLRLRIRKSATSGAASSVTTRTEGTAAARVATLRKMTTVAAAAVAEAAHVVALRRWIPRNVVRL